MAKLITPAGDPVYADPDVIVHLHGDHTVISHVEDLEPIFEHTAQMRKLNNNGFSKERNMRYLGTIPLMTLLRNPELANDSSLKKYLRERPRCRAVAADSF